MSALRVLQPLHICGKKLSKFLSNILPQSDGRASCDTWTENNCINETPTILLLLFRSDEILWRVRLGKLLYGFRGDRSAGGSQVVLLALENKVVYRLIMLTHCRQHCDIYCTVCPAGRPSDLPPSPPVACPMAYPGGGSDHRGVSHVVGDLVPCVRSGWKAGGHVGPSYPHSGVWGRPPLQWSMGPSSPTVECGAALPHSR